MEDKYGCSISAGDPKSLEIWNSAMSDYLDFSGTPVKALQSVEDSAFLLGPVFCAAMRILGGAPPDDPNLQSDLQRVKTAAHHASKDEAGHAVAVNLLSQGEFSQAAREWDKIILQRPNDLLAHKCAHETWFLVGDIPSMLASTTAALGRLTQDDAAYSVAVSQHAFALEESGDYASAEGWARLALDLTPSNCWALHALAHVYETQNRHVDSMALFEAKKPIWEKQNLLNAHIWWHLALRLIESGSFKDALSLFDENLADVAASNRFRLTDGTSLLWRLELAGVDVGKRWGLMADKWGKSASIHTNAFLDMHAALAFACCPDHSASDVFFDTLGTSFAGQQSENAEIFDDVLKPLVSAMRRYRRDPMGAASQISPLLPKLHRIGGSIVQRELVERSYSSALLATGQAQAAQEWLQPKSVQHPNTPWLLRDRARAAEANGDIAGATLLNRRADVMFRGFA